MIKVDLSYVSLVVNLTFNNIQLYRDVFLVEQTGVHGETTIN